MEKIKKTPLYNSHIKHGGKIVEFAGWYMPVQFQGIKEEHLHVRSQMGLFDVSHMGEIRLRGRDSLKTLQWLTTNDASVLKKGQAQYSLFPNEKGGVVDDLIVYCIEENEDYLLCVNAANIEKDYKFLMANNCGAVIENESDNWGQIAIQGPLAVKAIEELTGLNYSQCPSFNFIEWKFKDKVCYLARTGYTGEDGGEIFVPTEVTEELWELILGKNSLAQPIGLGARDTLRTEMRYPLYGHDITDSTNPYSAGLGWVVKDKKGDFLGKTEMMAEKAKGLSQKLVGIEVTGKGIAREGYKVFSIDSEEIGVVTSGTLSPSLNKAIAIAYVDLDASKMGTKVLVQMRNKMIEAEVTKTPFYTKG
jgi:aminomethyltransferase